jgi:hypothetical protein
MMMMIMDDDDIDEQKDDDIDEQVDDDIEYYDKVASPTSQVLPSIFSSALGIFNELTIDDDDDDDDDDK